MGIEKELEEFLHLFVFLLSCLELQAVVSFVWLLQRFKSLKIDGVVLDHTKLGQTFGHGCF